MLQHPDKQPVVKVDDCCLRFRVVLETLRVLSPEVLDLGDNHAAPNQVKKPFEHGCGILVVKTVLAQPLEARHTESVVGQVENDQPAGVAILLGFET
jgi:hypothetical protein